jgi:hypothetical protein
MGGGGRRRPRRQGRARGGSARRRPCIGHRDHVGTVEGHIRSGEGKGRLIFFGDAVGGLGGELVAAGEIGSDYGL